MVRTKTDLAPHLRRNRRGRDLVVGDVHGHFTTVRHALAELGVGPNDRVLSLGDLVDRGPDSATARNWITHTRRTELPHTRGPFETVAEWIARGRKAKGFDLTLRGNHEQMMLAALEEGPPRAGAGWSRSTGHDDAWSLWERNGGRWWSTRDPAHDANAWRETLRGLPYCATVDTARGPVGLVHACPVHEQWEVLEREVRNDGDANAHTRMRALWSRVRHGHVQREIGETGREYTGPIYGVEAVITGHTPVHTPAWKDNVLAIDTGVHLEASRKYARLTVARIDTEIETYTFDTVRTP